MKRNRSIILALGVPAALAMALPMAALASGPLLSGYGGPGGGAQVILGATLVGGGRSGGGSGTSGGGASGGGTAGSLSRSGSAATAKPGFGGVSAEGAPAGRSAAAGAGRGRPGAGGPSASKAAGARSRASAGAGDASRTGTRRRAAGANPHGSSGSVPSGASLTAAGAWFSGGDLLALVLVAAALGVVAVATARLARSGNG